MITVRVRSATGATTIKLEDGAVVRDLTSALERATGIAQGSQEGASTPLLCAA